MRACLIIAACIAAWCFAAEPHAQDMPDTPLVAVNEIGPITNWVEVHGNAVAALIGAGVPETKALQLVLYGAEQFGDANKARTYLLSAQREIWRQAAELGEFVCALEGRRGVALSEKNLGDGTLSILIACARQ